MKILMVNKFLHPVGGAETYVLKLGEYWSSQGHEVEYFGMEHPENLIGNELGLYTSAVDFHKSGFGANLVNPFKIIYSIEAKKKMMMILRSFQPDVVHINNFNYQLTPSILVAIKEYKEKYKKKIKVVYTAHDSQLVCPNHYLYRSKDRQVCEKCLGNRFWYCIQGRCIHQSLLRSCLGAMEAIYWEKRKIYQYIDVIVCPSYFMKEKLDTNRMLATKTVMLHNFVGSVQRKVGEKKNYILYFGRYSEEKGIGMLLEICRELPQIPFVFAGKGPMDSMINGISNVQNVGFLSGEALNKVIREARFSICPSECNENYPFSVIESVLQGTPVLCSDCGGILELIEDGHAGWMVPAGDKTKLKKRIKEIWICREPEIYSEACRRQRFDSVEEYGEKLYEIYQN